MDDDTLQKLSNGQLSDDSQPKDEATEEQEKPRQNYAFLTPTEAGYRETDPNKISAAPRPQPGMTFTPTGGSVSNINHQLNRKNEEQDSSETPPAT